MGVQNIRFILTSYITAVLLSLGFVYIGQKPEQYFLGAVSCPSATPGDQHSFRAMQEVMITITSASRTTHFPVTNEVMVPEMDRNRKVPRIRLRQTSQ